MDSPASGLFALRERLERARERSRLSLLIGGLVYGLTAAFAVFALAEIAARSGARQVVVLGEGGPAGALAAAAAALLIAVVVTLALVWLRTPSMMDLARLADHRFTLDERLSTALEGEAAAHPTAVALALRRDAARRAALLDASRLVPIGWPRASWLLPLAIAFAAAALLIPPSAPAPSSPAAAVSDALATADRADLAGDIARVAEIVRQQAETRDDPYLGAVARTLDGLSRRTLSGEIATRGELAGELASLEAHAQAAVARARDPDAQRIPVLLDALQNRVAPPPEASPPSGATDVPARTAPAAPGPTASSDPAAGERGPNAPPASPRSAADLAPSQEGDLDDLLDQAARGTNEARMKQTTQPAGPQAGYFEIAKQQGEAATRDQVPGLRPDNAELLGAASDSGQGDSRLAGQGTDELTGGGADLAALDFETDSDMRLAADDTGGGRRVQMKTTPEAVRSDVDQSAFSGDGSAWTALPEAVVSRDDLDAESRAVAARYLTAIIGQTE